MVCLNSVCNKFFRIPMQSSAIFGLMFCWSTVSIYNLSNSDNVHSSPAILFRISHPPGILHRDISKILLSPTAGNTSSCMVTVLTSTSFRKCRCYQLHYLLLRNNIVLKRITSCLGLKFNMLDLVGKQRYKLGFQACNKD